MATPRTNKQIAILKKGKTAFFIKSGLYFAAGGLLLYAIFLYQGARFDFMRGISNPTLQHGLGFLFCAGVFAASGLVFANRFWGTIPWQVFSSTIGKGKEPEEIIATFGMPDNTKETARGQELFYHKITTQVAGTALTFTNVRFVFKNGKLANLYRY